MIRRQPRTTTALSAGELPRHPPAPAKVSRGTQTWAKLGTSTGAKKKDTQRKLPRNCLSPGHQVSSPGGGSSTHRRLQEEAFQNVRYHPLGKEIPPWGMLCMYLDIFPASCTTWQENGPFLSKITSSGSFLHPAPDETASCFQTLFLHRFCNPSANTWSLSSPFSNTTRFYLVPK